ncbi:hypothetical protein [Brevundimonas sp. Root1423]|uniref:hypothetical protein n=1 Tax=Brevundimonas sp. Root1423 TaxID=1736462 RepID=UPI0006F99D99|nr:hypothetical protein [Brevundimonas sp. Root1423]KQY75182.1 hypothetical protein ASD25_11425 [Brevundimonas sp. Root1423]
MIRELTVGERALAEEAFGDALIYDTVRILSSPKPFDRAFVAGRWFGREWIVWPGRFLPADMASSPLKQQATFIHELTHVWQAQQGVNLLTGKLKAGDRPSSYEYPVGMNCGWADLNIEQQAMVVEHRFRLSRGLPTPGDQAFYDRVCPIGRPLAASSVEPISSTDTVTE